MNKDLQFYIKTKKDWDKFASVRNSNKSYDLGLENDITNSNLNWNLPSYTKILEHKDLQSITDEQKRFVMGTQLLEFVEKTTILEVDYVNKVANNIALGKYNLEIPEILKLDALKIYTDEGFHAHFSKEMSDQIKSYYKISDDITPYLKNFFVKLNDIGSKFGPKNTYLSELASTIVSETLIVQDISNEMKGIVYEPIKEMFRDHMVDEAYHANYFSTFFKIIWPQLPNEKKEILGFNLCEALILLNKPRVDIFYYSLSKIGFDRNQISKYINEIYNDEDAQIKNIKKRSSNFLKLLNNCKVFDIRPVKEKFVENNLL